MSMVKIELVGALRYGYKGDKYERGMHYLVKEDRAKLLLRLTTDKGFHVFRQVGATHTPVAPRPAPKVERDLPVVDTTKTQAEQYDDAVAAAAAEKVEEAKPVVVIDKPQETDISEEEALAALDAADEADGVEVETGDIEEIKVEEVNVAGPGEAGEGVQV